MCKWAPTHHACLWPRLHDTMVTGYMENRGMAASNDGFQPYMFEPEPDPVHEEEEVPEEV